MKKILLVEDDVTLGQSLSERLLRQYEVQWAKSFQDAWATFHKSEQDFDLVIFDIGLPDGSGFDLAEKMQKEKQNLMFLFLTAQADAETRLKGFEIGAQEFIPKPFHLKELLIRVHHVLDTHSHNQEVELPELTIDLISMSIKYQDGTIEYPSVTDMKVLKLLIEKSPRVLSRDDIMNEIWGPDKDMSHRSIDNVIVRLRGLFRSKTDDEYIRSVRGVGYQWNVLSKETK